MPGRYRTRRGRAQSFVRQGHGVGSTWSSPAARLAAGGCDGAGAGAGAGAEVGAGAGAGEGATSMGRGPTAGAVEDAGAGSVSAFVVCIADGAGASFASALQSAVCTLTPSTSRAS